MSKQGPILGVAVVGLGVGEQHARAFHDHPSCRVRSLLDIDASRAELLARSFPEAMVAASLEEILERRDIDVVSIASFDDAHFEQTVRTLAAGKHAFVEKPLCRSLEELAHIKDTWLAAGGRLKLRSNLILRAAPLYRWLRERIRNGHLGRLYAFNGDYLYGRLHKITEEWRGKVLNYSVMLGGGIHLVDLLLWLTGERPAAVTATGNQVCTQDTSFQYNDFVTATFDFHSGLVATITANFGCVHRHQHVLRVFGTRETFLHDDAGARLHESRDPSSFPERIDQAPLAPHKGALVAEFVEAILSDADDGSETQSFFDGVSVCIAADRAVSSGRKETIEYV